MNTQVLPAGARNALSLALETLRAGGLVAFPTDTVYGLGALAFNDKAVESIYISKGRSGEKAIPILLADVDALPKVAIDIPVMARRLAERFWPGPLTLVVLKHPGLPDAVSATATVGVRVPDHPVARTLLKSCGPLAVSSANVSGQPAPRTAEDAFRQLAGRVSLILDGGQTPGGTASTVLDCTQSEPVVLRAGPLTIEELRAALK
jgi:L-threonylcarbamoyladenylate synthase